MARDKSARTMIKLNTFEIQTPYFIDATTIDESVGFRKAKAEKLLAENPLIDPYTPFYSYTSILPSKSLQLPNWCLEASTKNINAFFTPGKLLSTKYVPKEYDASNLMEADSWIKDQESNMATDASEKEIKYAIKPPISGGKGYVDRFLSLPVLSHSSIHLSARYLVPFPTIRAAHKLRRYRLDSPTCYNIICNVPP
ncbi:hypothetical protein OIDMADRAFT_56450 [Oidiodendron maius Zn]|uniref:Uncharacterized protein n=1 Tax=Oidiodendron maius (strain Zn) TaxID=913774 RepID=A0A0C3DBJ3_OIDMZ|nr:hypothetical protein OIDMADRAFT_56450 [Oidiodendron maius Zn]